MTKVVHCKREKYDIYIGRPSKWGNQYSNKDNTLATFKVASVTEAIEKYAEDLKNNKILMGYLYQLKDKVLGCWCKPKEGFKGRLLCHGQILAALCDGVLPKEIE
jgi:hypothetical protein